MQTKRGPLRVSANLMLTQIVSLSCSNAIALSWSVSAVPTHANQTFTDNLLYI